MNQLTRNKVLLTIIAVLLIANLVMLVFALMTWIERRLLSFFQYRLGPNRVGPKGVLQPILVRPSGAQFELIAGDPRLMPHFHLALQSGSDRVLAAMHRGYTADRYLDRIAAARAAMPDLAVTTDIIVGFPGETEDDLAELERFLTGARLDAVGVFGYSDEDGTEAAGLDGKLDDDVVRDRVEHISRLADELVAQRAEDRHGEEVLVLLEGVDAALAEGRAAHQAPEVDGTTTVSGLGPGDRHVGRLVPARVTGSDGADLGAVVA